MQIFLFLVPMSLNNCGTVARRQAHDLRVVGPKPAMSAFEESILGQGVNTSCASLHPGV